MATIFFSHASKDDPLAEQIVKWLDEKGFSDVFVDHQDIRGGDKWAEALRRWGAGCRIIICLVTPAWLASDECMGEFIAGRYMGKRIIPLIAGLQDLSSASIDRLQKVQREDQGFNISSAIDETGFRPELLTCAEPLQAGLRAGGALASVGLDPEAFEIDAETRSAPFPGLESFNDTDADAALFYGRSTDIAMCLEELRNMQANADRRSLAILGASGSGKSSLMKAGVLPRLRRERSWIVLRSFRPGADALLSFVDAWSRSFAMFGVSKAPGEIRRALQAACEERRGVDSLDPGNRLIALRAALDVLAQELREASGREDATILIALDQAEELMQSNDPQADSVCECLRALLLDGRNPNDPAYPWACVFTIRSDSFSELQRNTRFVGLSARCIDIRPVPSYRVDDIVERPAARYGVQVTPTLLARLLSDAQGDDALPLLAFALRQLWDSLGSRREMSEDEYDDLNGLAGLIEAAAEKALRRLRPHQEELGSLSDSREAFAAAIFVPGLVSIGDLGSPIRRVAPASSFSKEEQELLDDFIAWRLVVRKRAPEPIAATFELAHDAVLRFWPRLIGWLKPEVSRLEALRYLNQSSNVWDYRGRPKELLVHRGNTLREAQALTMVPRFRDELGLVQNEYLAAAAQQERSRKQRVFAIVSVLCGVFLVTALILGAINQSRALERAAMLYWKLGNPMRALPLAVAAVPHSSQMTTWFSPGLASDTLSSVGFELPIVYQENRSMDVENDARFSQDSRWLRYRTTSDAAAVVDAKSGEIVETFPDNTMRGGTFSGDSDFSINRDSRSMLHAFDLEHKTEIGRHVEVNGLEGTSYGYDAIPGTSKLLVAQQGGDVAVWDLRLDRLNMGVASEDLEKWVIGAHTSHALVVDRDTHCVLWDTENTRPIARLDDCVYAVMSADGEVVVTDVDTRAHFWNARSGRVISVQLPSRPRFMDVSEHGNDVYMVYANGHGEVWSTMTGQKITDMCSSDIRSSYMSPDEKSILVIKSDETAVLCDASSEKQLGKTFSANTADTHVFSAPGGAMGLISYDNHGLLVDTATGDVMSDFDNWSVDSLYFTPDGKKVFSDFSGNPEGLWTVGKKGPPLVLAGEGGISDIYFSADGSRAAINRLDDKASVWDVTHNLKIADVGSTVGKIVFSKDGTRLLVSPTGINSGEYLVALPDNRSEPAAGAALRDRVCKANARQLMQFSPAYIEEISNDVGLQASNILNGLPWNPCDWRGLKSLEGWAQMARQQMVNWFGILKYRCGESSAFGTTDDRAAKMCVTQPQQ